MEEPRGRAIAVLGPVSKQPDEFGRRCIPSGFVVLPRHTLGMPRHPALPAGCLDALGSIWLFLRGPFVTTLMLAAACSTGEQAAPAPACKKVEKSKEAAEPPPAVAEAGKSAEAFAPPAQVEKPARTAEPAQPSVLEDYLGGSRVEACRVALASLAMALDLHYARYDAYPATLNELRAKLAGRRGKLPKVEDPWKQPFFYQVGEDEFTLCSAGPDRVRGTEDDLCFEYYADGTGEGQGLPHAEVKEKVVDTAPCAMARVLVIGAQDGAALGLPVLKALDSVEQDLAQTPRVKSAVSLAGLLRRLNFVMYDSKPEFDRNVMGRSFRSSDPSLFAT